MGDPGFTADDGTLVAAEFRLLSALPLRPDAAGRPARRHDAGKNGCGLPLAT